MGEFDATTIITYIYVAPEGLVGALIGAHDAFLHAASLRTRG
jgi:hypothetical protein